MRSFENTTFNFLPIPTDIHFGFGIIKKLPEFLDKKNLERILLVTDKGIRKAGLVDIVTNCLTEGGFEVDVFDGVHPDSGSDLITEATRQAKSFKADSVLGLGGGSSLDTAKAVALMTVATEDLMSYTGLGNVNEQPLPMIAVPTTAGTGSEVTLWSVFTDDDTGNKVAIGSVLLYPDLAICDPELTINLPSELTASTGMDALTHAIECYTNNACQPISGALALQAIERIGKNLSKAVHSGKDLNARYQILLGSTMAGIAMNPTRLGLAHALAMPLGSKPFNIPHGVVNAITLPHVMKFNCIAKSERFTSVAEALGSENPNPENAYKTVFELAKDVGIPSGLKKVGFNENAISSIAKEAMKSGNVAVNPRKTQQEDLEKILKNAL